MDKKELHDRVRREIVLLGVFFGALFVLLLAALFPNSGLAQWLRGIGFVK